MNASSFSSGELQKLFHASPTVASLKKSAREVLLKLAKGTDSVAAKKLWAILQEEKARLEYVETTFKKIVTKAVDHFETGILDIQKQGERKKLQKMRAESEKESSVSAEKILRDLEA